MEQNKPLYSKKKAPDCEACTFYDYDEYTDEYYCRVNLDEDDAERYLRKRVNSCPHFVFYDEYKAVRKQN